MEKKVIAELAPKQLDRVLGFFSRVESKASFVFAMNSALLGVMAVHVTRADFEIGLRLFCLIVFAGVIATSYVYVFKCSFPSLSGGEASLVYFKTIAAMREDQFVKAFRAQTDEAFVDDILCQAWRNSQILTKKFHAIKFAFIATGLSLLPWTAFLLLVGTKTPAGS